MKIEGFFKFYLIDNPFLNKEVQIILKNYKDSYIKKLLLSKNINYLKKDKEHIERSLLKNFLFKQSRHINKIID